MVSIQPIDFMVEGGVANILTSGGQDSKLVFFNTPAVNVGAQINIPLTPKLTGCELFVRNNIANAANNSIITLWKYTPNGVEIVGTSSTTTSTSVGIMEIGTRYLITIGIQILPTFTNWAVEFKASVLRTSNFYFEDGIEINPSLPSGIVGGPLGLYGNKRFTFTNTSFNVGSTILLAFADLAKVSGQLNVVIGGDCIGKFIGYSQAFNTSNSILVNVTASSSAFIANGFIDVTINNVGSYVAGACWFTNNAVTV